VDFQGIGLAVSSNLAKNVMSQLQKTATSIVVIWAYKVAPLSSEVAKHLD